MKIRDVTPFLLRGDERYGAHDGAEAVDQGDWLLLIRLRTVDGLEAWADVETLGPVAVRVAQQGGMSAAGFMTLGDMLTGRDVEDIDRTWHELFIGSVYYGRRGVAMHVLSAIDNCLWSLRAQSDGVELSEMLGGRRRQYIPAYASTLFRATPEANAEAARAYVDRGFTGVKFGWGCFGRDAHRDRDNLAAITSVLGPQRALMVDPGWYITDGARLRSRTDAETGRMLTALSEFAPAWVEDVVHPEQVEKYLAWSADFPDLAFAAGEQQATVWEFRRLLETDALRYLQPDLSRCGGLTVARQLVGPAMEHGTQLVTHSWLTDLLHNYSLQFLSTLPECPWVEFNVAQSRISRGVVLDPLTLGPEGTMEVPALDRVQVDRDFITRHAVAL